MKRIPCVTTLCVGLLVALGACGGDEVTAPTPTGPFMLIFQGDASFHVHHEGNSITVAVVRTSDGTVVVKRTGKIITSLSIVIADLDFSVTFPGLLVAGVAYEVHYWIDSNFGGGTEGVCDPKAIDHQWNVAIPAVEGDVTITEHHNPDNTVDVCSTFGEIVGGGGGGYLVSPT